MKLLDYKIPPFKTTAWVSDEAKSIWNARFKKISEAILKTTVQAVLKKEWDAQYLVLEGYLYFTLINLTKDMKIDTNFEFLGDKNLKGPIFYEVFLSNKGENSKVKSNCCWECSQRVRLENKKEFVWEAALNTANHTLENNVISLSSTADTSVFWQHLLVSIGPQHRCSLQCRRQQQLQKELIDWMLEYGFEAESSWMTEIYSWPIEWSAYHGICELRTPIVKLAYDTDATAENYTIQVAGDTYPEEGATGKRFPYRQKSFLRITDSKSFKIGLEHGSGS